jgi:hypothetical protein
VEDDIKSLSPGVAMIVSTYIERPILVDIRTRKSKHGGASVPVVKDPLEETQRIKTIPIQIDDRPKSIMDTKLTDVAGPISLIQSPIDNPKTMPGSRKIIDNARTIIETPGAIINKARSIIETKRTEPQHEEIKEQIERKKGKRETSLYRKMFGSRKK